MEPHQAPPTGQGQSLTNRIAPVWRTAVTWCGVPNCALAMHAWTKKARRIDYDARERSQNRHCCHRLRLRNLSLPCFLRPPDRTRTMLAKGCAVCWQWAGTNNLRGTSLMRFILRCGDDDWHGRAGPGPVKIRALTALQRTYSKFHPRRDKHHACSCSCSQLVHAI
jgi:hypothetical protein